MGIKNRMFLSVMLIMQMFPFVLNGETIISNNEDVFGVWTREDSPYKIIGKATVPSDSILIIQPGVQVLLKSAELVFPYDKFDYETLDVGFLHVRGQLYAVGTEQDSIQFTRLGNTGKWGVILFDNSPDESECKFCKIEHSYMISQLDFGNAVGAISSQNTRINVSNCSISKSTGGVAIRDVDSLLSIKNNKIFNNSVGIGCNNSHAVIAENDILNNVEAIDCWGQGDIPDDRIRIIIRNNVMEENYINIQCAGVFSIDIIENIISRCSMVGILVDWSECNIDRNIISFVGDELNAGERTAIMAAISHSSITNNVINNSYVGLWIDNGTSRIVNNVISKSYEMAFVLDSEGDIDFINNTIANNKSVGLVSSRTNVTFTNSIFYENKKSFNSLANIKFLYCFFDELFYPYGFDGLGNSIIANDPCFDKQDTVYYSLAPSSPCIDAGTPDTLGLSLPKTDVKGNSRIYDASNIGTARIDIGASEFGSSKPSLVLYEKKYDTNSLQVFPNPFNLVTKIQFQISSQQNAQISIFNVVGKKICTLVNETLEQGLYQLTWNGMDQSGRMVSSGLYFVRCNSGGQVQTMKISLLK